jgi:hypothetical protein
MSTNQVYTDHDWEFLFRSLAILSLPINRLAYQLPRRVPFTCTQSLTTFPIYMVVETALELARGGVSSPLKHRNDARGDQLVAALEAFVVASRLKFPKMYDFGYIQCALVPARAHPLAELHLWTTLNVLSSALTDHLFTLHGRAQKVEFSEVEVLVFFRTYFGIPRKLEPNAQEELKAKLLKKRTSM